MDTSNILATLRAERDQLNLAIATLESLSGNDPSVWSSLKTTRAAEVKAKPASKKRLLSSAARKKMSEAAKARWVTKKQTAPDKASTTHVIPIKATPNTAKKWGVNAETRKKMAEAQQKRWAKKKTLVQEAAKKMAATATVKKALNA